MEHINKLAPLGLFDARVPRYTSYPTAPVFSPATDEASQSVWLGALDPQVPVSVYVHIPFCERLCWFCACRTQGTTTLNLDLSRFRAAPSARLSHLPFESDRAFPAQC